MPQTPKGSRTASVCFVTNSSTQIDKARLDRAIAGGIKKACLERESWQVREEIFSKTYLLLVRFFAKGKKPHGKISSLAFAIAYRVAIDVYRRPGAYEAHKACGADYPEVRTEEGPQAVSESFLRAAIRRLSANDREVLVALLQRDAPLPRETPLQRKVANATAQREKRARDRLKAAVRELEGDQR